MKIAVCDDDIKLCHNLTGILQQYFTKNNMESTDIYHTGADFLEACKEQVFDVVFMDIYLCQTETGVDVIRQLRELRNGEDVFVVYISTTNQPAAGLAGTRPFDYLLKPLVFEQVAAVMDKLVAAIGRHEPCITVKVGNALTRLRHSEILYIESTKRLVYYHTKSGKKGTYGKLNDIEVELASEFFIRVHHSFLVNYQYIRIFNLKDLTIVMDDGRNIPISHPKKKTAYASFLKLCGEDG